MFLLNNSFHDGDFNMSFDMFLVHQLEQRKILPTLRLYGWKPFAISLGYNQSGDFLDKEKCISENVDVVKRPTGGRAVYHAEELTYAVVMFAGEKNISTIHNEISQALVCGLKMLGVNAELSSKQIPSSKIYFGEHSTACFSSITRSEVNVNGKKIIGSAQRRFGNIVLQHGSIMIGSEHKSLPKFYREFNESQFQHLQETTTEIKTVLGKQISFEEVASVMQHGFEKQWEISFEQFPETIVEQFFHRNEEQSFVLSHH